MSKRLYAGVVSSDDDLETGKTSGNSSIFDWMEEYQFENEEVALRKALDISKVSVFSFR